MEVMEDWGLISINSKVKRLERVCAYIVAYELDQQSLLETFFHASRLFQLCTTAPFYEFLKHSQCSTPPSWKHTSSLRLRRIERRQSLAWPVRFHELPSSELTITLHVGKACRLPSKSMNLQGFGLGHNSCETHLYRS